MITRISKFKKINEANYTDDILDNIESDYNDSESNETLFDYVLRDVEGLDIQSKINIHNTYCRNNNIDDEIFGMHSLDEIVSGGTAREVLERFEPGFNVIHHEYFKTDGITKRYISLTNDTVESHLMLHDAVTEYIAIYK